YEALAQRLDSPHEAQHQVMECLGQMPRPSRLHRLPKPRTANSCC
ncbi:DUF1841 family protein, partial [Ralstonia pseudosolanacearum]